MDLQQIFDDVEAGITRAEVYAGRVFTALEGVFAGTALAPFAGHLASVFAAVQADVVQVKIVVNDVEQALVMTEPVYGQIVSWLKEFKSLALPGETLAQTIEGILGRGIPLALEVVAPGLAPMVMLSEKTLLALLPLL